MILENHVGREGWEYADLLVADYFTDYPLKTDGRARVYIAWDPQNLCTITGRTSLDDMDWAERVTRILFRSLPERYNGFYDWGMHLWIIHGSVPDIFEVWKSHYHSCVTLIGGDDDTYDYWPNAVDMLLVMAQDLGVLTNESGYYFDRMTALMRGFVPAIEAINGPMEDYEAEEYKATITEMFPPLVKEA